MTWQAVVTLGVIILMLFLLVRDVFPSDVVTFGALVILILTGILHPSEALSGFSNTGMLTVAVLFPIAYAVQSTGLLEQVAFRLAGHDKPGRKSLLKMLLPVYGLSSFLNNTPVVAMFIPVIRQWALENRISPSKFLIPLSYSSIFGGLTTLIGTSTNLVVAGLLFKYHGINLNMFDPGKIGVPAALVGFTYLLLVGIKLLPDNRDLLEDLESRPDDYLFEFSINNESNIPGKSVSQAGLRNLKDVYLAGIIRDNVRITPVLPDQVINKNDILLFSGNRNGITRLNGIRGLEAITGDDVFQKLRSTGKGQIIEAVVSPTSFLIGRSVKDGGFRNRYNAAIIAVRRHGERIESSLGEVVLRAGDTLLVLGGSEFVKRWGNSQDFYLVSGRQELPMVNSFRVLMAAFTVVIMMVLAGTGILPIFHAAAGALVLLLITRVIGAGEARRSVDLSVIVVIASTLGISVAISKTGLAALLAHGLIGASSVLGPVGILAAIYLTTTFMTEIITNNAAAALVFPIAMAAVQQASLNPVPFAIAVAVAASASFMTPLGYQTNLMVYGPGGYTYRDFIRVGLPLNVIYFTVSVLLIPLVFKLTV